MLKGLFIFEFLALDAEVTDEGKARVLQLRPSFSGSTPHGQDGQLVSLRQVAVVEDGFSRTKPRWSSTPSHEDVRGDLRSRSIPSVAREDVSKSPSSTASLRAVRKFRSAAVVTPPRSWNVASVPTSAAVLPPISIASFAYLIARSQSLFMLQNILSVRRQLICDARACRMDTSAYKRSIRSIAEFGST